MSSRERECLVEELRRVRWELVRLGLWAYVGSAARFAVLEARRDELVRLLGV